MHWGSERSPFSQELFQLDAGQEAEQGDLDLLEQMGDQFPYLAEMMAEISHDDPDSTLGWCDDQAEFEFGLDLILDGLDKVAPRQLRAGRGPCLPIDRNEPVPEGHYEPWITRVAPGR